ncbi:MAG TPA: tyrosine-type recombinase/integrase [Candidatus Faecousia gallistercoris]|nr:tyrosine-type recombinase/integrase [Candidatus Faecousia gallistercoris]
MANCIKCKKELPEGALYCPYCGKKQTAAPKKHRKRANNTGTVYKMSGKRAKPWAAQRNGVWIGAYPTREDAIKALERIADREITDDYNLTFAQVYDRWKPEHSRRTGPSGMAGYAAAYKHCESIYNRQFRKLRTEDFQGIIAAQEAAGRSKSHCEKIVQLFGQLSKWAIREGIATTNYAQFVTVLAQQKSHKTPFTDAQILAIRESDLPAAQIALVLIGTGCRPNELFQVPVANCAAGYFVAGSKTEAGRNRVIPVSPIGLEAYTRLLHAAQASNARRLIDAYPGNKTAANYAKRDFKELMDAIGAEDMTPYNCRHTFSTLAVRSGVRPELLQKIMGHADYATTVGVYTHLDKDDILAAAQAINVTSKLQAGKNGSPKNTSKSS